MTTTDETLESFVGQNLHDLDGEKIGEIVDVYLDDATDQPEWFAVKTGWIMGRVHFVPIQGVGRRGDDLVCPYTEEMVKGAPHAADDGRLSEEEENELYNYYGLRNTAGDAPTGYGDDDYIENTGTTGRDVSGPTTDNAMTRSEEEMRVNTQSRESGRVRLRKYLVTEQQTVTVPVTREEVRIEREPITDANVDSAMSGPELSEEEHEITLHAEEAIVDKKVVPKERVRLDKEVYTDEQQVSADLKKERIDVEGDVDAKARR